MNEKEALSEIIAKAGLNRSQFAAICGYSSPAGLRRRLNSEGALCVDTLTFMLDKLNYELVIRPRGKKREEIIIDVSERE